LLKKYKKKKTLIFEKRIGGRHGGGAMEELFPVLLAAALGIAISLYTRGYARWILSCLAVACSGLAATTFTGEFQESWLYLLQDLAEAASGLALGFAVARWALPRFGIARAITRREAGGRSPNAR
jgi:hypothetical protein